ncbi:hypothetical protein HMSSN139_17680 [Paenibacillus sp. HMSSN-139]|nr:hypothetical protein HMSSN139_17680 [Paenibacillus sp. HMSSN-139]
MNKRKLILYLLMFLLFILEGTLVPWLVPSAWQSRIAPHLVYVVILYFSVYENRHSGLILGLVFGILHDIVFTAR